MLSSSYSNRIAEYLNMLIGIIQQGRNPYLNKLQTFGTIGGKLRDGHSEVLAMILSPSSPESILTGCEFRVGDDWFKMQSLTHFLAIDRPGWAHLISKLKCCTIGGSGLA